MKQTLKRHLSDFPIQKRARLLLGDALLRARPEDGEKIDAAPFTKPWGTAEKLIRNGLYYRAFKNRDHATLRRYLADYWAVDGNIDYHADFSFRFEDNFLLRDARLAPELERLSARAGGFGTLCEIGCGNGLVIKYLADHIPGFKRYLGIDISPECIEKNKTHFDDSLDFIAADAVRWVAEEAEPSTVFLTNGGVFEYFTNEDLRSLFASARDRLKPTAFAIVENVAADHDLDSDKESHVYGREFSFSHNYPFLFREAGFRIRYQDEYTAKGERWINLLADYPDPVS